MSDAVIRVEGIGKRYQIGERAQQGALLRDVIAGAFRRNGKRSSRDAIWAVRDVSFEVKQGEVVGLIGRNGAGKSTLLKILARITRPTVGHAELHGRIASLLEVGTGFHAELTGRENVFLSGAILGMSKAEITRKFDAIVAFAEVERFIDTPIKHYSSGMGMRLAFAVAAHLEPEILLVDEVLSVGDARFQKKCLGKMEEVSRGGRTILFVSHSSAAVTRLCSRCVLLNAGRVEQDGPAYEVIGAYLRDLTVTSASRHWDLADAPGDSVVRLRAVRARKVDGTVSDAFDIRHPIGIDVVFDVLQGGHLLAPNVHFFSEQDVNLFITIDSDPEWRYTPRPVGRYTSTVWIPGNFLAEGSVVVRVAITTLANMNIRLDKSDLIAFQVFDSLDGDSARGDYAGHLPGLVRPLLKWSTAYEPERNDASLLNSAVSDEYVQP
ncbi:MAG TPA: ABC transporter ATP-binding protein [Candidatus Acidoferrales bacterium]|nr:ABC transporter ATP-binding protein [Candidatus Acidoferrales bacterium]